MRGSKFTDAQKAFIIRQGERQAPTRDTAVCAGSIPDLRVYLGP
jgi:hypothetical protein